MAEWSCAVGALFEMAIFLRNHATEQFSMKGLNSVFSATKNKAHSNCSTTHLTTILYFVAGKIRLPQF